MTPRLRPSGETGGSDVSLGVETLSNMALGGCVSRLSSNNNEGRALLLGGATNVSVTSINGPRHFLSANPDFRYASVFGSVGETEIGERSERVSLLTYT